MNSQTKNYNKGKEKALEAYEMMKQSSTFNGSELFMKKYGVPEDIYKMIWMGIFSVGYNFHRLEKE